MKDFKVYQTSGMLNFLVHKASDVRKTEQTLSGDIVSFTADAQSPIKIIVDIDSTGWTGCEVTRTGKNLCDPSKRTIAGTIAKWYANTGFLLHKDVTYAFSSDLDYGTGYIRRLNGDTVLKQGNVPFTYTPSNDEIIYLQWYSSSGATSVKAQLEIASSATEFEEYQGTTLSITFPDEVGSVTDGTLTIDYDGAVTLETGGQSYTLTSVSPIETLVGDNNIWADTGEVSVTYLI